MFLSPYTDIVPNNKNLYQEKRMTKADLIAVIEKQANLSPKQAEKVVNI